MKWTPGRHGQEVGRADVRRVPEVCRLTDHGAVDPRPSEIFFSKSFNLVNSVYMCIVFKTAP
jgi:hypothetical protein